VNISKIFILLSVFVAPQALSDNHSDLRSKASFYIDTYGLVDLSESKLAQRAQRIFKRIRQVAEDPVGMSPTLKIIKSKGRPWAIALPDGYIILSKAAIDICYNNVSLKTGDARLAFVLGHELAHLTSKDFWHQSIYLSLSSEKKNNSELENIRRAFNINSNEKLEDWNNIVRKKELQADDKGFTYASLANFQTGLIFSDNKNNKDFIKNWVRQTRSIDNGLHFSASDRSAFLINRFKQMTSKIEYFMSAVRLAHFGRYDDAMHFFEKYKRAFPAHEVLNNMGYVQLQLARNTMPNSMRHRFWLPVSMENAPGLVPRTRTFGSALSAQGQQYLENAVVLLKKASSMHLHKINSRINLATAYLYLGKHHKARASIEEAYELDPASSQIKQLRAIILYEQEKDIDMWPAAVRVLKSLPQPKSPSVLFNLARLYEERARNRQAKKYWTKLFNMKARLPEPIYIIACRKIHKSRNCARDNNKKYAHAPIKKQLRSGDNIKQRKTSDILKNWRHQHEEIGPLPVDLFLSDNGNAYLAIDNTITMAIIKNHSNKSTKQLLDCCGKPSIIKNLGDLELWSYGSDWSALIDNNKVSEYWVKN